MMIVSIAHKISVGFFPLIFNNKHIAMQGGWMDSQQPKVSQQNMAGYVDLYIFHMNQL